MSNQTTMPNQHQLLSAVRALLAAVQQPLGPLDDALEVPEQLLAELAPALAVVDFSPFAQLTVNAAESHQSPPQPPQRSTSAPPVVSAFTAAMSQPPHEAPLSPTRPDAVPQPAPMSDLTKTLATPIFALPSQKRATMVGASSMARDSVSSGHSLAQPVTAQATPVTASPVGNAGRSAPLASHGHGGPERGLAAAPLSAEQTVQQRDAFVGVDSVAASPLATMSLLATIVDGLLATTPAEHLESMATQGSNAPGALSPPSASRMHWPTIVEPTNASILPPTVPAPLSSRQSPVGAMLRSASTADLTTLLTGWPTVSAEHQPTNGGSSGTTTHPTPDPWTLAQLINDVLAEEARRHGVDLS